MYFQLTQRFIRNALDTTHIILFSANLAFIVTHLYSWLLKWFYRPEGKAIESPSVGETWTTNDETFQLGW